jgi:linoleoyl-CoA desaturase
VFSGEREFFQAVRRRVDAHFEGRPRRGDPRLYRKVGIVLAWFFASFALLLAANDPWVQLGLCLSYATAGAAVGFNVFHDSIHGSFSPSSRVNQWVARLACAVLGPARYFWWFKHNRLHHSFTNVYKWDDDLETRGALRLSPRQPWLEKHRNQHRFFWLLYGLTTLEWVFVRDFVQYFSMKINPFREIPPMSRAERVEFWVTKAIYFAFFVGLPFALVPFWRCLVGMLIFHFVLSVELALIFNLAHASEGAEFPEPEMRAGDRDATVGLDTEWAVHQLATTVNFGRESRLLTWLSGGLNHQIEHHLFPGTAHTYYPELSPLVQETAREFGVPYNDHSTYLGALRSHWRMLARLAQPTRAPS